MIPEVCSHGEPWATISSRSVVEGWMRLPTASDFRGNISDLRGIALADFAAFANVADDLPESSVDKLL